MDTLLLLKNIPIEQKDNLTSIKNEIKCDVEICTPKKRKKNVVVMDHVIKNLNF